MSSVRVDLPGACLDGVGGHLLELGHYLLHEIAFDIDGVQVLLEVRVGQLVPALKPPVVVALLLDSVVS